MLASRNGVAGNVASASYVCLSCRLKTQQKRSYRVGGRATGEQEFGKREVDHEGHNVQKPAAAPVEAQDVPTATISGSLAKTDDQPLAKSVEDAMLGGTAHNNHSSTDSTISQQATKGPVIRFRWARKESDPDHAATPEPPTSHPRLNTEPLAHHNHSSMDSAIRRHATKDHRIVKIMWTSKESAPDYAATAHYYYSSTDSIIRRKATKSANVRFRWARKVSDPDYAATREPVTSHPQPNTEHSSLNFIDEHLIIGNEDDVAQAELPKSSPGQSNAAELMQNSTSTVHAPTSSFESTMPSTNINSWTQVKSFSSWSPASLGRSPRRQCDIPMPMPQSGNIRPIQAHLYHSSSRQRQEAAVASTNRSADIPSASTEPISLPEKPNGIRAQLRQWQELHGNKDDPMPDISSNDDIPAADEPVNSFTRLPDEKSIRMQAQRDDDEKDELTNWANVGKEGYDGTQEENRFLKMGDLVEIEFTRSEREGLLAVYVQSIKSNGVEAQFFTMSGRWMHLPEKAVQYSIPGWVSPDLVTPLLAHLPDPEESHDLKGLMERSYIEDLSVPRDVGAPLVKRMVDFYNESQEVYRRHATALDSAHEILSHDTDLRYGSLASAATTLLRTPSNELPVTALFTVRKAISNGGFAFNIDRRSHRLTGYMQIRSKEQVRMVENVRNWIRQWQDDLAATAAMNERELGKHKQSKGARVIYGFLEKAKAIIERNRENRQPTRHNNVGISKVRLPLTPEQDCVKTEAHAMFSNDEEEIVRFIESWSCSQMFLGLRRIESLPPLILQALGLYEDLGMSTGFLFLQELGVIMPHENRVKFDQHLLLPSSQHSKPLQTLMQSLLSMKNNHNFVDSMAGLRHDWKDLPVFCIDDAEAHEIDDGVSVEPAGTGPDGRDLHWVHIHVANPTAFFSRDHPLAKMARHMGESIYMPERTYMMLPRWATQMHFSLQSGRPCMTFSAKMDEDGNAHEHKITAGIIHNVIQLTADEVDGLFGLKINTQRPELILTVGGNPPPQSSSQNTKSRAKPTEEHVKQLSALKLIAEKRAAIRRRAGGVFFDSHRPKVSVWQSYHRPGLAWDHPFRKGSRTVEGDPVIQFKTRGLLNWFKPDGSIGHSLVQELMLLAGETAASWCSARQIPIIYRGTRRDPNKDHPERFWEENIQPYLKDDGTMPLHLGIQYIQLIGYTVLRTSPQQHSFLGLQSYAKVTSPLRRYGDMIHHWQIEAALRNEAETGRSLIAPKGTKPDRSFLPFSTPVLDTIMTGLHPRESIITSSKSQAEVFWTVMIMFRKTVFGEDGHLPFLGQDHYDPTNPAPLSLVGPPKASVGTAANDWKPLRFFVYSSEEIMTKTPSALGYLMELNISATMMKSPEFGANKIERGDVWEVYIEGVDVYRRAIYCRPVRLLGKEGAGLV